MGCAPGCYRDILEVDEDSLRSLRTQKGRVFFAAQRPTVVLNIRLNSRGGVSVPSSLASGPSTWLKSFTVVRETDRPLPMQLLSVLGP